MVFKYSISRLGIESNRLGGSVGLEMLNNPKYVNCVKFENAPGRISEKSRMRTSVPVNALQDTKTVPLLMHSGGFVTATLFTPGPRCSIIIAMSANQRVRARIVAHGGGGFGGGCEVMCVDDEDEYLF